MTKLVNVETGELVVLLSLKAARKLTDEIKASAESLSDKLAQAYDGRAWVALEYLSWRDYAAAEFDMSQSRAYQLLDKADPLGNLAMSLQSREKAPRCDSRASSVSSPAFAASFDNFRVRSDNVEAAQRKLDRYDEVLDRLEPYMAHDHEVSVGKAIETMAQAA
jgi:hypothetical protein